MVLYFRWNLNCRACAAAISARKAEAEVEIIEKTDLLLGLGDVGGIMRKNGRYTAAEELET